MDEQRITGIGALQRFLAVFPESVVEGRAPKATVRLAYEGHTRSAMASASLKTCTSVVFTIRPKLAPMLHKWLTSKRSWRRVRTHSVGCARGAPSVPQQRKRLIPRC